MWLAQFSRYRDGQIVSAGSLDIEADTYGEAVDEANAYARTNALIAESVYLRR